MLTPGTKVSLRDGMTGTVGDYLGEGTQGWVHLLETDQGETLALKWYKPLDADQARHQREAIGALVAYRPPPRRFLWPISVATIEGVDGFGYVMPLRPATYVDLVSLFAGTDEHGAVVDPSFAVVFNLAFGLLRGFGNLHTEGFAYRDINFGNLFFDPADGAVLICDCDNVGVDDTKGLVIGTPRFMAPEIVRGDEAPSIDTDRWSLAVLVFYILLQGHPLEGERCNGFEDEAWMRLHFGEEPLFCLDEGDTSNRPLPDSPVTTYWAFYPEWLRRLFRRSFTEGIAVKDRRVLDSEWIEAMVRLRDSIMVCPSCGGTCLWDREHTDATCVRCDGPLPVPLVVVIKNREIVISSETCIMTSHFDFRYDEAAIVASAAEHPRHPGMFGFANASQDPWTMRQGDHDGVVGPGQAVQVIEGVEIDFPLGTGVIRRASIA